MVLPCCIICFSALLVVLNGSKIKRHTINLSQQAKAGTIAQATVSEFEGMDKDEEGNVLGEIYAMEAILATLSHALVNDDKTLKMAPSASEDQKILDAIPAKTTTRRQHLAKQIQPTTSP